MFGSLFDKDQENHARNGAIILFVTVLDTKIRIALVAICFLIECVSYTEFPLQAAGIDIMSEKVVEIRQSASKAEPGQCHDRGALENLLR